MFCWPGIIGPQCLVIDVWEGKKVCFESICLAQCSCFLLHASSGFSLLRSYIIFSLSLGISFLLCAFCCLLCCSWGIVTSLFSVVLSHILLRNVCRKSLVVAGWSLHLFSDHFWCGCLAWFVGVFSVPSLVDFLYMSLCSPWLCDVYVAVCLSCFCPCCCSCCRRGWPCVCHLVENSSYCSSWVGIKPSRPLLL